MTNHLYDALMGPVLNNTGKFLSIPGEPDQSFQEFSQNAAKLAHVLVANGIQPGDRVVVQAPKRVEMLALYIATVQAGAVFLPLNTGYKLSELDYFISDATPRVIVCQDEAQVELAPVAQKAGATILTLNSDGSGTLSDQMQGHPETFDTVARGPEDLAALLYTSGTTGRSKGAMLTHENLLSNALTLKDLWRMSANDRLIHALPIFHTHGLFVAINTCLVAGSSVHFMPAFNPDDILAEMPASTVMMGVPTFYTRLLADRRFDKDVASSMRLFVSGSAPLLAETHIEFEDRTGHRILERYGMTETNMNTSNPYDGERRAGTVGFPLDGVELRIVDGEGQDVAQGEVGMIEVRGANVFKGYWNMPEKTAEELRDNGFFITGDLGQMDTEGYVSIVGRNKDLIITGGYNVYPKEVEDVLNAVDGVLETAVYGIPHSDFGEQIIAAVVPMNGVTLDPTDLEARVDQELARFKHPRQYLMMDALPRNTMGKVQKNVLRDAHG